jgi:hypothetical protein
MTDLFGWPTVPEPILLGNLRNRLPMTYMTEFPTQNMDAACAPEAPITKVNAASRPTRRPKFAEPGVRRMEGRKRHGQLRGETSPAKASRPKNNHAETIDGPRAFQARDEQLKTITIEKTQQTNGDRGSIHCRQLVVGVNGAIWLRLKLCCLDASTGHHNSDNTGTGGAEVI